MTDDATAYTGTSGDDYLRLNSVSSGGPMVVLDGLSGSDTLDASAIYFGSWTMQFRCYDRDDDFAGYDTIGFADYQARNFEILYGSDLGANNFFLPHYDGPLTLHGGQFDDRFFSSDDHADIMFGRGGDDYFYLNGADVGPVDKLDSQARQDVIQDSFCGGYLGAVADGGCRVGIL